MTVISNAPKSGKQELLTRWRKLLEHKRMSPISNKKKPLVAQMMNNLYLRSKGLLKEEKLTTTDIQNFDTVLIPMIRRIAPELIALDILGTQVMEKPAQLIFALRAFNSGRDGTLDGWGYRLPGGRAKQTDRVDDVTRAQILIVNKQTVVDDEYGYDIVHLFSRTGGTAGAAASGCSLNSILASTTYSTKGYFNDITSNANDYYPGEVETFTGAGNYAQDIYGRMIEFNDSGEVTAVGADIVEGRLFYAEEDSNVYKCVINLDSTSQAAKLTFNQWMIVADNDTILDAANWVVGEVPSADTLARVSTLRGAFENEIMYNVVFKNYSGLYTTAEMEAAKTWNEVTFDIDSTLVRADGRTLKARYTLEVAEDLMAYHNIDAEEELINMISYEILAEMNREVVERIYTASLSNGNGIYNWDYGTQTTGADGRWHVEKYHGLYTLMNKVSGDIAIATRRGMANFAICSMPVKVALESVQGYSLWTDVNNNFNSSAGIVYAGTLAGKYKVFVDTFAYDDYIMMGYKGDSEYDAGLFYCPFIPLTAVKAVDPENFQPRLGFRTRYGIGENPFGANLYYRYINVENLDNSFGASYSYIPSV